MDKHPLEVIKEKDSAFFDIVESTRKFTFAEGALPVKYKYLVAMALDASIGAPDGVKSLAMQAIKFGATKEEILDAARIAYFICGTSSVYTAARGLSEIL
ncbi:MAG: carboxymuconolactone decarboxylase family protein [Candidatus Goldiibacteriota bacterium]